MDKWRPLYDSGCSCEHCARITRGVAVTRSGFVAEGGVVGEVNVPQRGSVVRSVALRARRDDRGR